MLFAALAVLSIATVALIGRAWGSDVLREAGRMILHVSGSK